MTRRRMAWLRLALAVAACCGPRIAAVPVMSGGRVVDAEAPEVKATVLAARQALSRTGPQGPYGPAAAHVFAFADFFCVMLCHLARTVEAAGGWLHVLGLRDGAESPLPVSSAPAPGDAETRGDEPWHFPDKAVMLKKHLFLWRAIRSLPANATVIFVDGFDVLFQRPLADVVATYGELAGAAAERNGGVWPVVFGGERNCWPFPHDGGKVHVPQPEGSAAWVHEIAPDAALSANHSGQRRYPYGATQILGDSVCGEWLARRYLPPGQANGGDGRLAAPSGRAAASFYPFLCAGGFVGTASALRRLYRRLFALFDATREYHDQALMQLLLLQQPQLGIVDDEARIFMGLHGHDDSSVLSRPLCRGDHFEEVVPAERAAIAEENEAGTLMPVPGYRLGRRLGSHLRPPPLAEEGRAAEATPSILHFNGNGKRHLMRCVTEFRSVGILGGTHEDNAECTYFDHDRKAWNRFR
eukprot:TRINITY_DN19940_c0_g1_i1.p1 TRINITY_DN19940_c0_g1~~TRINITY_DN19940_c0_g1_i1.p1  ORF type:complete len:470 (+),score=97.25 TRINITY_DN19940_c0_g1_i1:271-1680(+)